MKVVTKQKFFDKKADKIREVGDTFSCSKDRFAEIDEVLPGHIEEFPTKKGK